MKTNETEARRIRGVYAGRVAPEPGITEFGLFWLHSRERTFLRLLKALGMQHLRGRRILDAGCGEGHELRRLIDFGADYGNLYGIDLMPERVQLARQRAPMIRFECGNIEDLPFDTGFFDVCRVSLVLTSILDEEVRRRAARELLRVLRPGGALVCYDFVWNPANRNTRGLSPRDVKHLFPGCRIIGHRTTLAPPLARAVLPVSHSLAMLMETVPFLRLYYMCAITKPV